MKLRAIPATLVAGIGGVYSDAPDTDPHLQIAESLSFSDEVVLHYNSVIPIVNHAREV